MKITVKYGLEPIYLKNEKNETRVLTGYIVSKCFVLDTIDKYIVLFPYAISSKKIALNKMRTPNNAIVGYNTTYVNKVYDTYNEARSAASKKNQALKIATNTEEYKYLLYLQKQIVENTQDLEINRTKYMYKN